MLKINQTDIKVALLCIFLLIAQYKIFKPKDVSVEVVPNNEFNQYLKNENNQLRNEIKTLKNEIKTDSTFIMSTSKDSLRDIANRYNLH